jgi:N-acetylneuraminate synthase
MPPEIRIGSRRIGKDRPVFIVAELSANHHQIFDEAVQLIRAAREAGADAVKLQTYTPDTLTIDSDLPLFRAGKGTIWDDRCLHEIYREAYTPWEWLPALQKTAEKEGLQIFSTPFDTSSVDYLDSLGVPAYKIASFEVVDLPLVRRIAQSGKPILMSTGMATESEIEEAVQTIQSAGNHQIALLKCTSAYPAPASEMNLVTIPHMAERFGLPVGLSDHTLGIAAPVAAVTLGACIIEKHFTLSRAAPGPDSPFSLEPVEFRSMVTAIRDTEQALGRVHYGPTDHEAASHALRRSLFVVEDMEPGEAFSEVNLRSIRPGYGLPPKHYSQILGRRAAKRIARGTPLSWDLVT